MQPVHPAPSQLNTVVLNDAQASLEQLETFLPLSLAMHDYDRTNYYLRRVDTYLDCKVNLYPCFVNITLFICWSIFVGSCNSDSVPCVQYPLTADTRAKWSQLLLEALTTQTDIDVHVQERL